MNPTWTKPLTFEIWYDQLTGCRYLVDVLYAWIDGADDSKSAIDEPDGDGLIAWYDDAEYMHHEGNPYEGEFIGNS